MLVIQAKTCVWIDNDSVVWERKRKTELKEQKEEEGRLGMVFDKSMIKVGYSPNGTFNSQ